MNWLKSRLNENSTLLGAAVLIAMSGNIDLQALQALSATDLVAMGGALVAMIKGDK